MPNVTMKVNGRELSGEVEGRTLLAHFLREGQNLTGTHIGCDTGQCGACTVHVDGVAVKSCNMFAADAEGAEGHNHRRHGKRRWFTWRHSGGVSGASRVAMRVLYAGAW